jgi:hypothetical protein
MCRGSTDCAQLSRGLSGREILNFSLNAIYAGSIYPNPDKWNLT